MKRFYLLIIISCCGLLLSTIVPAKVPAKVSAQASTPSEQISTGISLYEAHCARCHRSFAKTTKPQRPVNRLRSSIKQFPAMSNLDFLTEEDLEALAAALATISF